MTTANKQSQNPQKPQKPQSQVPKDGKDAKSDSTNEIPAEMKANVMKLFLELVQSNWMETKDQLTTANECWRFIHETAYDFTGDRSFLARVALHPTEDPSDDDEHNGMEDDEIEVDEGDSLTS